MSDHIRPGPHEYFMHIAMAVRSRANCLGSRVGAVIVRDGRIISTGYNGTPQDMRNCEDGGCERCANREKRYPSGTGYDICICVHAEQNAILTAARFGISVEGSTVYSTMRPCFGCTKEMLQARIRAVYYLHDWNHPNPETRVEYDKIQGRFQDGIRKLDIPDPDKDWAVKSRPPAAATADPHGVQDS